jgi:transglutaminase-like putative cysteine protease
MPAPISRSLSQHSLIFLLTSIGLIMLPHGLHLPKPLFLFFFILLIWRLAGILRTHWLPNRLALLVLTSIGLGLLYTQHQGMYGRDAGVSLFVVALGLKLLEIHGKREIYLVVFLAFVVAASQFLYEQSIWMAVYILLVCAVLLATLIVQNSMQIKTPAALKSASVIIGQALPIALVVFVLFPRLEAPRWLWLQDESRAKSGLSNTLEPGSISDLSLSDALVFRVKFAGEPPPPNLRYWRGPVYLFTDGVRWMTPPNWTGPMYVYDYNRQFSGPSPEFSGVAYSYTLLMEPQKQDWVFALELAAEYDPALHRNKLLQLLTNKNPGDRNEYQISSYPHYNTGAMGRAEQKDSLQLPGPASEKIRALVRQLQGYDVEPKIFIRNLFNYFHQENFHYTLTPPLMTEQPIETFLFTARSGFCSHYATAFVYLLRVAGIPARVVGGYQGGQINQIGHFLEIRQADAHAWAEVWLEGQGWVRFDPTAAVAPERIDRGVNIDLQLASGAVNFSPETETRLRTWLKQSRQAWQSIDYNWQRWVINYDTASQAHFLSGLGINDWTSLAGWLIACIAGVTLILSWFLLRSKKTQQDKSLLIYRRFCRKLAKAGIEIKPGEGPKAYAERAKSQRQDLARQIGKITAIFIRLRYEQVATAGDLQLLSKLIGELRL